jgi:hypothetical protein
MSRPRKARSVTFDVADGADLAPTPDVVTGLRFTIRPLVGDLVLVDYTGLRPRPLALAVARALRQLAEPGGPLGVRSTVKAYANTLRQLFAYLAETDPTVSDVRDLRAWHVDGFEGWLEGRGLNRTHLFTVLTKVLSVLRLIGAEAPELLASEVRERLRYTSAKPFERPRPRDAYSPYVARQLRDAARSDVARIIRRLQAGPPKTPDPALAAAHAIIADQGVLPNADRTWQALYRTRRRRGESNERLSDELHEAHHLTALDVAPFLVLLALDTGLEIECCKALTVDCLRNAAGGTVEVGYLKRRAQGAEHKFMRVRDGGSTTPGGLIRQLITLTAAARLHSPSDSLWVYYRQGGLAHGLLHPRETLDAWTARHAIVDDEGRPLHLVLSRLRKTHKALWYLKTEGHMARFAVGHTPQIAAQAYADVPALRPLHEATVAEALDEQVALARGPRLVPEEPPRADSAEPVSGAPAGVDDQDLWLARCGGFYSSPFGTAGEACPRPFWGCLECVNAVITARKLPAILAFQAFAEAQRHGLSASDWAAKFGRVHARIVEQILPAFGEGQIATARLEAAGLSYLPPEVRL